MGQDNANVDKQLTKLVERFKLDTKQAEQTRVIITEFIEGMKVLRKNNPENKAVQEKELVTKRKESFFAILNDDQLPKMVVQRREREARRKERNELQKNKKQ
jgi:hypothetical protein